jgi:hypothetical protein
MGSTGAFGSVSRNTAVHYDDRVSRHRRDGPAVVIAVSGRIDWQIDWSQFEQAGLLTGIKLLDLHVGRAQEL